MCYNDLVIRKCVDEVSALYTVCPREIPSMAVSGMQILSVAFPFGAGSVKA